MGFYWSVKSAVKVIAVVFVIGFLTGLVGAQSGGTAPEPGQEVADVLSVPGLWP